MSARISLMYKRSGGCNTEHKCSECKYYIRSKEHPREFMCERHGEDGTYWQNWMACKFWKEPEAKPKRKPRKTAKYKQEATGQMQMVWG